MSVSVTRGGGYPGTRRRERQPWRAKRAARKRWVGVIFSLTPQADGEDDDDQEEERGDRVADVEHVDGEDAVGRARTATAPNVWW